MNGSLEKRLSCHFSVKAEGFYTPFHCRGCLLSTDTPNENKPAEPTGGKG